MAAGDTASANASASVTLYEPITIAAADTLRFGKIARDATAGVGTVVIASDGATPPVVSTGLTSITGAAQGPATFTITGTNGASFGISTGTITQPGTGLEIGAVTYGAGVGMTLASSTGTLGAASAILRLGATLTIAPGAVASATAYSATIPVTVTYQ